MEYYASRFNFTLTHEAVDLSAIRERGEAVDLGAEEQSFRFRRFDAIIEGVRRAGRSMSSIVFGGDGKLPSDYDSIMSCLQTPKWIESLVVDNNNNNNSSSGSSGSGSSGISSSGIGIGSSSTLLHNTGGTLPTATFSESQPLQPAQSSAQFDHQAVLKKKLEAQAAERQKRKDLIAAVAEELWDALIDHTIRFNVAEWSAAAVELICQENRSRVQAKHSEAAQTILTELLDEVVQEQVQANFDLMSIRMRAFEAVSTKTVQQAALSVVILNGLEREICDELVKEVFLECKAIQLQQRKTLKRMRELSARTLPISAWKRLIHPNNRESLVIPPVDDSIAQFPVHLVFVVYSRDSEALEASKSLLSPLAAASPPNELAHLQTFLPAAASDGGKKIIQMISSYQDAKGPVLLSRFLSDGPIVDFFSWPPNYPGPTHVFTFGNQLVLQNIEQIPWRVHTFAFAELARFPHFANGRFKSPKEVIESLFSTLPFDHIPRVEFDLLPSQLIPPEIFEMFIKAPEAFTVEHVIELFRVCCAILWESSLGQRMLFWHPCSAGRSGMLECLSKAPQLPAYFGQLMQGDLEKTFHALDEAMGPCLVACKEILFTNQSLSMIQNALRAIK